MGGSAKGQQKDPIQYFITAEEQVICLAPVDSILGIRVNNVDVYKGYVSGSKNNFTVNASSEKLGNFMPIAENSTGYINLPQIFGGFDSEGGLRGNVDFRFGRQSQSKSSTLIQLVDNIVLSATKGIVSIILSNFYLGTNPYAKAWHFRVKSTNYQDDYIPNWYPEKATIIHGGSSAKTIQFLDRLGRSDKYFITNNKSKNSYVKGFRSYTDYVTISNGSAVTIHNYDPTTLDSIANSATSCTISIKQKIKRGTTSNGGDVYVYNRNNSTIYVAMILNENLFVNTNGSILSTEFIADENFSFKNKGLVGYNDISYFDNSQNCIVRRKDNRLTLYFGNMFSAWRETGDMTLFVVPPSDQIADHGYFTVTADTSDCCIYADNNCCYYYNNKAFRDIITVYSCNTGKLYYGAIHVNAIVTDYTHIYGIYCSDTDGVICLLYKDTQNRYKAVAYDKVNKGVLNTIDITDQVVVNGSNIMTNGIFICTSSMLMFKTGKYFLNFTKPAINEGSFLQADYNPVHAIRDILTNKTWGLGKTEDCYDDQNFKSVADALYNENFGISFVYESTEKASDFLQKILNIIGGVLRLNRETGKLELKLIRGDYDVSRLPVFDENNILSIDEIKRTALSDCINQVTLKYTDYESGNDASIVIQDLGLLQQTEEINNADIDYPYIYWKDTAQDVAIRELCDLSSQFLTCEIKTNTDGRKVNLGDVIVVNFPRLNIQNIVFRVNKIRYGSSKDNTVTMSLSQDKYNYPKTEKLTVSKKKFDIDIDNEDSYTISFAKTIEAPFFFLYKKFGLQALEDKFVDNPSFSKIAVLANKYNAQGVIDIVAKLSYDNLNWVDSETIIPDVAGCTLYYNVTWDAETFNFNTVQYNMAKISKGWFCFIDDEICYVTDISLERKKITVKRGCFDTMPAEHSYGTFCYFVNRDGLPLLDEEFMEETVSIMIFGGAGDNLINANGYQVGAKQSLVARSLKPYNVANVKIAGEYFPRDLTYYNYKNTPLNISFCCRNRLSQITDGAVGWTDDNIQIESGTTVVLLLISPRGKVVLEQELTSNSNDILIPSDYDSDKITIYISTFRDGIECYTPFVHTISIKSDNLFIDMSYNTDSGNLELTSNNSMSANLIFNINEGVLEYSYDDEFLAGDYTFYMDGSNLMMKYIDGEEEE